MWLGYEYTKMNLLDKVTNLSDNSIIEQYTYDANGNLITKYALAAKLLTQYEYNAAGQIKKMSVTAQNGLIPVGIYEYSYYADGNQQQKKETANGTGEKLTQYDYDGAGRLIQEQTSDKTMSYQYDASGNRSALNVSSGESYSYTYDKNNRLKSESKTIAGTTEEINYFYDPNGNTISKMSQTYGEPKAKASVSIGNINGGSGLYTYNGFNQLTEAFENGKTTSYTYDANGLRKSKTINNVTTNHIWDGNNIIADETNGAYTKYIRGNQLISSKQGTNETFYTYDAHGNVTNLIDKNGNITKTYTYDAFGVEENIDESDKNPFRYCGEYYDKETNSIYLRARYYSPSLGRFKTEDPIKDGLNWYVYCSSNPVVLIDPNGLFDYNTIYSYGSSGVEVKILQNELKQNGYLGKDGNALDVDGKFGINTDFAVRNFQRDRGLTVDGIVGKNTWSAFGFIYRTKKDIELGVKIVTVDLKQYYDVSIPVNNAVWNARKEFADHYLDFKWFYNQVKAGAPWDIKLGKQWEGTIGTTFPGSYNTPVFFFGSLASPEILGNITFGYLGSACGFPPIVLLGGADFAAGGGGFANVEVALKGVEGFLKKADSKEDRYNVVRGMEWFYVAPPQPGPAPY